MAAFEPSCVQSVPAGCEAGFQVFRMASHVSSQVGSVQQLKSRCLNDFLDVLKIKGSRSVPGGYSES